MSSPGLSELCVECSLCCDGSLFRFLPVDTSELDRYRKLGLPVVTQSGQLAMPLPCSKLEARCCTVYADRPSGCRTFVCHLGRRLELGDATFTDALKIVREAQRRIEVLRAAMPGLEPVVQRATREASLSKGHDESALDALQAVHDWLDEWIHWPEGPRTGT